MIRSFASIQCLRGVAALAVVISHLSIFEAKYGVGSSFFPSVLGQGIFGVDLFFVISGFIITMVSMGRFGQRYEASKFLWRRFVRIYPIYWLYYAIVLAIFLLRPAMVNSTHAPPHVVSSFFLLPSETLPLVIVAWTLTYEIFFYLIFACLLKWLRQADITCAIVLWASLTVIGNLTIQPHGDSPFLYVIFSPLVLEFLLGCVAAITFKNINGPWDFWLIWCGIIVILAGAFVFSAWAVQVTNWSRFFLFGTGAAMLVWGMAACENNRRQTFPDALVWFGGASYSLYLSHVLSIAAVGVMWRLTMASPSLVNHLIAVIVATAIAIIIGCVGFYYIERPLLRWLQGLPRRISSPIAVGSRYEI